MAKSVLSVWSAIRLRLGEFEAIHERRYRKCFRDHKLKTATLQLIEDFLFSLRPVEELRDRFDNGNLEIDDHEKVKLGSLYVDFGPKSILVPGRFFSTAEKVDMTLKLTRRRMEIFRGNVVPLFDAIPACDLEQCRTWISHLDEIV